MVVRKLEKVVRKLEKVGKKSFNCSKIIPTIRAGQKRFLDSFMTPFQYKLTDKDHVEYDGILS